MTLDNSISFRDHSIMKRLAIIATLCIAACSETPPISNEPLVQRARPHINQPAAHFYDPATECGQHVIFRTAGRGGPALISENTNCQPTSLMYQIIEIKTKEFI